MGRRKYKARLSTAGGLYVFSCRCLNPLCLLLYSSSDPPPWATCLKRFPDDWELNINATSVVRNAHVQVTWNSTWMSSKKTKRVTSCHLLYSAMAWDVLRAVMGHLLQHFPDDWELGHSGAGRCRSEAQPSSRLSFLNHGLKSWGMANFKKQKGWETAGRARRGGGEEKKLSHSVFCRPPVNGQFPQSLE